MTGLPTVTAPRLVRRALLTTAALTALFVAASAAVPEPAHAAIPTSVGELMAQTVEALFGDGSPLSAPFFQWLITVPNPAADYPAIGTLGRMTSAIGFALLGAVITVSVISYWAAGFTGGGGDILSGATKTAGVGLFIIAWPWIHESGIALVNIVSQAVLVDEDMDQLMQLTDMHTASLITIKSIGWIFALILLPIIALMMLGLTLTKIGLDAGVFVSYVAVPIAVAVSPVPGLAWLSQFVLRTAAAVAIAPMSWAFLLSVFAMLGTDVLRVRAETVGFPARMMGAVALAGLALLMFKLPTMILRQAGVAPPSGGFFKQAAAFMASQFAFRSIGRNVPDKFGGQKDSIARQRRLDSQNQADRTLRFAPQQGPSERPAPPRSAPPQSAPPQSAPPQPAQPQPAQPNPAEPQPAKARSTTPVAHGPDRLPTQGDPSRYRAALDRAKGMAAGGAYGAADGTNALDTIHARAPEYLAPTRERLAQFGDQAMNDRVTGRLADAGAADGLPSDVRTSFRVLAGMDPAVRNAVNATWEPSGIADHTGRSNWLAETSTPGGAGPSQPGLAGVGASAPASQPPASQANPAPRMPNPLDRVVPKGPPDTKRVGNTFLPLGGVPTPPPINSESEE